MNIDSDYSMRVDPFQRHVFTYIYIGSTPTLSVGYTSVYGVNIVTRAFDCNFGYLLESLMYVSEWRSILQLSSHVLAICSFFLEIEGLHMRTR